MPANTGHAVDPPPYPLHALTTYELRDYRRQLERALNGRTLAETAPIRVDLQAKLDEITAEEASRQRISDRV